MERTNQLFEFSCFCFDHCLVRLERTLCFFAINLASAKILHKPFTSNVKRAAVYFEANAFMLVPIELFRVCPSHCLSLFRIAKHHYFFTCPRAKMLATYCSTSVEQISQ